MVNGFRCSLLSKETLIAHVSNGLEAEFINKQLAEGNKPARCLPKCPPRRGDTSPVISVGRELVFLERVDFVADETGDRHWDSSGMVIQRNFLGGDSVKHVLSRRTTYSKEW